MQWRGDPVQQRTFIDAADSDVKDARAAFQRAEQEVRHFSYGGKAKAQQRLAALNNELEQAVKKLQQTKDKVGVGDRLLLGSETAVFCGFRACD